MGGSSPSESMGSLNESGLRLVGKLPLDAP